MKVNLSKSAGVPQGAEWKIFLLKTSISWLDRWAKPYGLLLWKKC